MTTGGCPQMEELVLGWAHARMQQGASASAWGDPPISSMTDPRLLQVGCVAHLTPPSLQGSALFLHCFINEPCVKREGVTKGEI